MLLICWPGERSSPVFTWTKQATRDSVLTHFCNDAAKIMKLARFPELLLFEEPIRFTGAASLLKVTRSQQNFQTFSFSFILKYFRLPQAVALHLCRVKQESR